jgi:uncharacterized OsmC-like protein
MAPETLRALQSPLKRKYRDDPSAAKVTPCASGRLGEDVTFVVDTLGGTLLSGLHPAAGGDGSTACSGDLLLQAPVACSGVTLAAVATAMGTNLRGVRVVAEGDLDFRGTLGVSKEVEVGFERVRLVFELHTDAAFSGGAS